MSRQRRTPYEKYLENKALKQPSGMRLCIDAHCQRCVGGDVDPGWRQRIRECTVECELRDWRPYK